jgi:hypothetical protein
VCVRACVCVCACVRVQGDWHPELAALQERSARKIQRCIRRCLRDKVRRDSFIWSHIKGLLGVIWGVDRG